MNDRTVMFVTSHASKGGTLGFIRALKQKFEAEGYKVRIVALYRGDGESVGDVDLMFNRERTSPRDLFSLAVRFIKACRAHRPFVIIGVMPVANIFGAFASRCCGAFSIATHHSPTETWSIACILADKLVANIGFYDRVICVSNAVAASFRHGYMHRFRRSISVIANGAAPLKPACDGAEMRRRLGLSPHEGFVLMVGRLAEQKNVVAAVKAAEISGNIRLVLAGEGPLRSELEKISPSNVLLLGAVDRQTVADLLHACDAFMQVSLYEGHSLALLEAIRAHRPLIVSDAPTQIEAVRIATGELAALICDPSNVQAIAQAMTSAVFDRAVRAELVRKVELLAQDAGTEAEMLDAYSGLIASIGCASRTSIVDSIS